MEIPCPRPLPAEADPALTIVRALAHDGFRALLAGGCVRDLLLGNPPADFDVATSARPEQVSARFRRSRLVGAQFGVVLVPLEGRWIEVATFRTDGPYADGRHPTHVQFSDERHDALRRDFTVNGLFLDPLADRVIDYVDGLSDLERRVIRAIGAPEQRFGEDHLRLIRAVRFAARLDFAIDGATANAIRELAPTLRTVAAERIRDELEKMLSHANRAAAVRLLRELRLLTHLWLGAEESAARNLRLDATLRALPPAARYTSALAVLLAGESAERVERIGRSLTLSNDDRESVLWIAAHDAVLDTPDRLSLAELKRLMAQPQFPALCEVVAARRSAEPDEADRRDTLAARLASINPATVRPPPLVTGDDLLARRIAPGPLFKRVLDELYTRQLNEELTSREAALRALETRLAAELPPG